MRFHLLSILLVVCLTSPGFAQTTRKSTSKAANVKSGALAAIDAAGATITLKSASKDTVYRYTEKTQILKNKRAVEIDAFKSGDSATVRFRKSSVGPATLYDLCDKASWDWLSRVRKETTKVKIKAIEEGEIQAEEGTDSTPIAYRVTEKTAWSKSGKPATEADFKSGDTVYVVPRLLPGGGIMATAVSDTTQSAAHLKERAKYTVSGTLTAVDLPNRKIALKSVSSDLRDITLAEDCEARVSGRDVPLTYLKPGQQVTVHLRKNEEDEREARLITIVSKRTTKKPPIKTPIKKHLPPGVMPARP